MKKEELIEQLEGVKSVTSTVDIDKMIKLIELLEAPKPTTLSSEMVEEISKRIESCLDHNSDNLVNKDDVTFDICYGNQIEVEDVYVDVYRIMEHITSILEEYESDEDEPNDLVTIEKGLDLDNERFFVKDQEA